MSRNDDAQKPSGPSPAEQPSLASKTLSWFIDRWNKISWQRKLLGALAILAFGYGLANPTVSIGLAIACGAAAYIAREQKKLAATLMGIAAAFAVTGGLGLAIENHFDEQRAQEQRKVARAAAKAQQALDKAEAAKKKEARIQGLDGAVSRSETWIAAKTGELTSFPLTSAQGALNAIVTELNTDITLAGEQKRTDIAEALQKLVVSARETFAESRKVVYTGQSTSAAGLYAEGKFAEARSAYQSALSELTSASSYSNAPSDFKEWASAKVPEVQAALDKAIRLSELPDAVAYFDQWRQTKKKVKSDIEDLGSQAAHTAIIVELARAIIYLNAFDEVSADENKFVPAKYRSKSFIKSTKKEIDRFEADAQKELSYVLTCGDKPNHWLDGGGSSEAKYLMKQSAHDPGSIEVTDCSPPELTMRQCWKYQCNVRGKNAFGAKVLDRKTFYQTATAIEVR